VTQSGRSPLLGRVLEYLAEAAAVYQGTPGAAVVDELVNRLHEPLRVAIAGRVKAGKSTLLNALVGEELAPTDAGECTRIVTWYRHGLTYRVTLVPRQGRPHQVPFAREDGAVDVDIGEYTPDEVGSLSIEWPSLALESVTLIDTPGIGSITTDVSARSLAFLTPDDDEQPTPSDAVIYLLRHVHAADVQFLEAFAQDENVTPFPVNALAVLSRADEMGVGRLDALSSAAQIAERYRSDPRLRALVQDVVPVAGLLAQAGYTLREAEFRQLRNLSELPQQVLEALELSADRFVSTSAADLGLAGSPAEGLLPPSHERRNLLDRLGIFGVRISVEALNGGRVTTSSQLAAELRERSGIDRLRQLLFSHFAERRDTLKARSALVAVERLLALHPVPGSKPLAARLEQLRAAAHELAELRLLNYLRGGALSLSAEERAEAELLLASGMSVHQRVGVPDDASPPELRKQLVATLNRWRTRGENPMSSLEDREAATIVVRTCEGLFASLVG
jgi:predicted GTPase